MKYRTETVAMNLAPTNGGATRKNPVRDPLREYLYTLIENNLLEYAKGTRTYKTTAKGLNFPKEATELAKLLQTTVGERQAAPYNSPKKQKVTGRSPV